MGQNSSQNQPQRQSSPQRTVSLQQSAPQRTVSLQQSAPQRTVSLQQSAPQRTVPQVKAEYKDANVMFRLQKVNN